MRAYKLTFSAIIFFMFCFANVAFAANVAKIGTVDLQRVFENSTAGKAVQAKLKTEKDKMEVELKRKGSEIEAIGKRLERESMVMSKEMRDEKEREHRIKINDFKSLQKKFRGELQSAERQLMNELKKDIDVVVKQIGKSDGYLLIINNIGIMYSPSSIDITDKLIQKLNASTAKKAGK